MSRPDVDRLLSLLKDFQRDTVDHVFARMYEDANPATRFLVADEAGLGKTMVARGLVAKVVDKLWDSVDRIDVVYICSNSGIARQNINRLNVTGVRDHRLPDRITLLPGNIKEVRKNKVNFISFTPGTSFNLGSGQGKADERALLYWLLPEAWTANQAGAISALSGWADRSGFEARVRNLSDSGGVNGLDQALREKFRDSLAKGDLEAPDQSQALGERFRRLADQLGRRAKQITDEEASERTAIVGALRGALAAKCIESLEPDLIILDEFQRFRDLLRGQDEAAELAKQLFNYNNARVLLLSATPYKMYTMGDENSGDDHYADFVETVGFLQKDPARNAVFKEILNGYRRELFRMGWDDGSALRAARDRVTGELRRVMVRTERLAVTPDRSGMLTEVPATTTLDASDVSSFLGLQRVARALDYQDVSEFWKSAPYLLNFMDDYQLKEAFSAAAEAGGKSVALRDAVKSAPSLLLDVADIDAYRRVDPANARLRSLENDTLGRDMWRLLWLPPSMPYYRPSGVFAELPPNLTKRLVFSAWQVVPKVVSALLTYEAERRMMAVGEQGEAGSHVGQSRRSKGALLRFSISEGRASGMPVLGLLYPCVTLSIAIDPLATVTSAHGLAELESVKADAREKCTELLKALAGETDDGAEADERWYWAAPLLLDRHFHPAATSEWFGQSGLAGKWRGDDKDVGADDPEADADTDGAWADHVELARLVVSGQARLGPMPADLEDVMAALAIAGPAVCALRALGRVTGPNDRRSDAAVRNAAGSMAEGLRALFNQPDVTVMLRRSADKAAYWRHVLEYSAEGCLQAVLDEYAHVLVEACGLSGRHWRERASEIAKEIAAALRFRTATVATDSVSQDPVTGDIRIGDKKLRLRSRFAVRYGSRQKDDPAQAERDTDLRRSFNSPFWPFVLCSTSVGQEGLDFHLYCHAVVHWNLPSNPVDLEQREGRVHRFKGHAVRKNVATRFAAAVRGGAASTIGDPWTRAFQLAQEARSVGESDMVPFWVYAIDGGSRIERHIPALPLSRDAAKAEQLRRSLAVYRMVFGQSRQEDMVSYLLGKVDKSQLEAVSAQLRVDLAPQRVSRAVAPAFSDDTNFDAEPDEGRPEVSLGRLSSLLDEFATKRVRPRPGLTAIKVGELLDEFIQVIGARSGEAR